MREASGQPQFLAPGEGPAEPGEYLVVIIYGPAKVKASAIGATGSITPGTRLAVDEGGLVRALQTVEVEGVQLAEDAPTIGHCPGRRGR